MRIPITDIWITHTRNKGGTVSHNITMWRGDHISGNYMLATYRKPSISLHSLARAERARANLQEQERRSKRKSRSKRGRK